MFSVSVNLPSARVRLICLVIAATVLLGSCGSNPPPKPNSNPIDAKSSAIGLSLKMRPWIGFVTNKADAIVFARLEEGVPIAESQELYSSTLARDEFVYLMNVEPGVYVAVAALYESAEPTPTANDPDADRSVSVTTYRNYFSCEMIEQTRVEVGPADFAFMGRIEAKQSFTFGDGDDCQAFFKNSIEEDRSGFVKLFTGDRSSRLDLKDRAAGKDDRREFLKTAKGHFAGTGWSQLIKAELSKLR